MEKINIIHKWFIRNLNIFHLSKSDSIGGAAKACYRIHSSLCRQQINSYLYVDEKLTADKNVFCPRNKFIQVYLKSKPYLMKALRNALLTDSQKLGIYNSPSLFPSFKSKYLNNSKADIINLHWVQKEMISITDIGNIRKPLVWTLHDMWAFCGTEHVSFNDRFKEGYLRNNKPEKDLGFDLDRYVWQKKKQSWKRPIFIVTPSNWMANKVRQSKLMHSWPVKVIPNCIDTKIWRPINKHLAKELLGLPNDLPILGFGTLNANDAYHKGSDLLIESLKFLKKMRLNVRLLIFGQNKPSQPIDYGFPVHYMGKFHDDLSMRIIYNAIELILVPSRVDNFPNVGVEATSCGTPAIGFNTGGMQDIVEHKINGFLANPFDPRDFAYGIKYLIEKKLKDNALNIKVRERALKLWNEERVSNLYKKLYEDILESQL